MDKKAEKSKAAGRTAKARKERPSKTGRRDAVVDESTESGLRDQVVHLQAALGDDTVVFNVDGVTFQTYYANLARKPGTRLFDVAADRFQKISADPRAASDVIVYERNATAFGAIIDYYRSDELHVPLNVCGVVMKRELEFWKIDENIVSKCCWDRYCEQIDAQTTFEAVDRRSTKLSAENEKLASLAGWKLFQLKAWRLIHRPGTSRAAMAYAVVMLVFVVWSMVAFCLETVPGFYTEVDLNVVCATNDTNTSSSTSQRLARATEKGKNNPGEQQQQPVNASMVSVPLYWLTISDIACSTFFSADLLLHCIMAPDRHSLPAGQIVFDVLSVVPTYILWILDYTGLGMCRYSSQILIEILTFMRMARIVRVFHLLKYFKPLRILLMALRCSIKELLMLLAFCTIVILVFASLIYYAEGKHLDVSDFSSIPIGMWWSLITITGVGYGDMFPRSTLGYLVGGLCAVSGLILFALTIPVISDNFARLYQHVRSRERVPPAGNINNELHMLNLVRRKLKAEAKAAKKEEDSGSDHDDLVSSVAAPDPVDSAAPSPPQTTRAVVEAPPAGSGPAQESSSDRDDPVSHAAAAGNTESPRRGTSSTDTVRRSRKPRRAELLTV